jgi:hypothetical protein
MKLAKLISPDDLIALKPDELGLLMLPVLAAWPHQGKQLQLVQFLPPRPGQPQSQDYLGYPADHRRRPQIEIAIHEAWAWLEGQALLIRDTRFGDGVSMLSTRAYNLAKEQPITPVGDVVPDLHAFSEFAPSALKPTELITLKPTFCGMSIDLKEAWKRSRRWWKAVK